MVEWKRATKKNANPNFPEFIRQSINAKQVFFSYLLFVVFRVVKFFLLKSNSIIYSAISLYLSVNVTHSNYYSLLQLLGAK